MEFKIPELVPPTPEESAKFREWFNRDNFSHNSMEYWFPRLSATTVPVPRTIILTSDVDFTAIMDGMRPEGMDEFMVRIKAPANEIGYPLFTRNGTQSGKHDWSDTCFVKSEEDLEKHILKIAYLNACHDIGAAGVIVLREFLDIKSVHIAKSFNGMPIGKERRYFIREGKVQCHHPYWPADAFSRESDDWAPILEELNLETAEEVALLTSYCEEIGKLFPEYWSVDFMLCDGVWYCIDMAFGNRSYHWKECEDKK